MSSSSTEFVKSNAQDEEHERNRFRIRRDLLLHRIEEQRRTIEDYTSRIEDLQKRATSAFILRNKSECLSCYIDKEISRYSKSEHTVLGENCGDFTQESVRQMQQEKLKLIAQLERNYKVYERNK